MSDRSKKKNRKPREVRRVEARLSREQHSQTLVLEVTPHRAPTVHRTIELRASHSLDDLHGAIQEHFELDSDHLFSFYMSGKAWDKETEYAGRPAAGERSTSVHLWRLGLQPGQRFLYLFDYGDELRHDVVLRERREAEPGVEYPRLIESVGRAPRQYGEAPPLDEELMPLLEALDAAMTEDPTTEAGTPGDLSRDVALAWQFVEKLEGKPDQLDAIAEELGEDVLMEWLLETAFELGRSGDVDAALGLVDSYRRIGVREVLVREQKARILGVTERRAEAIAEVDALLAAIEASGDDEGDARLSAVEVLERVNEDARAEAEARRLLVDFEGDELLESHALFVLAEVLSKQGKAEEAEAIAARKRALDEAMDSDADLSEGPLPWTATPILPATKAPGTPPVAAPPAQGRNEPCACGSGKKFKKCHGAPGQS